MQTPNKDGIFCDLCGTAYKDDFYYYSFDFRMIEGGRYILDQVKRQQVLSSLDVCTACMGEMKKVIVESNKAVNRQNIKDELKNTIINISRPYYYVAVTYAKVVISGQPNICTKCQSPTYEKNTLCKSCGNNNFVNIAKTEAYENYVEFFTSDSTYNELLAKYQHNLKMAGQWSTSS